MVNAQELRLGNWISNGEKEYTVDINMLWDIATGVTNEIMEPIKITGKILDNCGFKFWDNNWYFIKLSWLELSVNIENGQICIQPNKKFGSQLFSELKHKCTSLHHLQNLVHSLTGTGIIYTPLK